MTQDTYVIDIRLWLNRLLKNWYWFVISCFVFGLLGLYKYFSTTPEYVVDARIMLRSSDPESPLEQVELFSIYVLRLLRSKRKGFHVKILFWIFIQRL